MTLFTKIITNKYNIALYSVIIGFSFWYFLTSFRPIEITLAVPLSFYGQDIETHSFISNELISVTLKGLKSDFYNMQFRNLAIYINSETLKLGENALALNPKDLFLPDEIKLLHYKPSNIVIQKNKNILGNNG